MSYHKFYSDLSYFHSKLKDLLSREQAELVPLPASCSQCDYKPPNYCWHGKCVNSGKFFDKIGPSGVHALPLAAGINVGGHYFAYYFTLLFFSSSLTAVVKIPEGVVVGFQIFAWAPN